MCGILGIMTKQGYLNDRGGELIKDLYYGLHSLQHRGQEACGIAVCQCSNIQTVKNEGLVGKVLAEEKIDHLKHDAPYAGLGHVRYSTAGSGGMIECMPMTINTIHGQLSYVFNGTLVEYEDLKKRLFKKGVGQFTHGDSELIGQIICQNSRRASLKDAIIKFIHEVKCAYSIIIMTHDAMYIFRDRYGYRPLWMTTTHDYNGNIKSVMAASETCAFDVIHARDANPHPSCDQEDFRKHYREVQPGELVIVRRDFSISNLNISNDSDTSSDSLDSDLSNYSDSSDYVNYGVSTLKLVVESVMVETADVYNEETNRKGGCACLFEWVYFSRPDSLIGAGQDEICAVRERIGRTMAVESPCACDVVIGVPDSGIPMAIGYAEQIGAVYRIGFTKNRYIARTFIDDNRDKIIGCKYMPLRCDLRGKRVCLVDDSIVRGHTIKALVGMLKGVGCAEVHVRIGYAPVKNPCYMGINMKTSSEMLVNNCNMDEMVEFLGISSLGFISIEGLKQCVAESTPVGMCTGCLDGDYGIDW